MQGKLRKIAIRHTLLAGLLLWENSPDAGRSFLAQKSCARAMCGAPPDQACRPLFQKLGIMSHPSMYIYILIVYIFVRTNDGLFKRIGVNQNRFVKHQNRLVIDTIP